MAHHQQRRYAGTAGWELTLARLEAWVGLVDNIDPALAADQLVIPMAFHQAFQRVTDFHRITFARLKRASIKNLTGP